MESLSRRKREPPLCPLLGKEGNPKIQESGNFVNGAFAGNRISKLPSLFEEGNQKVRLSSITVKAAKPGSKICKLPSLFKEGLGVVG